MPNFLTDKQQMTLHDFVKHKKLEKVAEIEHISAHTVRNRLTRIYAKLRNAGDIKDGNPNMEIVEYIWKKRCKQFNETLKRILETKTEVPMTIQGHVCIPTDLYDKIKMEISRRVE